MFDNVPSALKEAETESRRRLRACHIDATYKRTHTYAHAYGRIKTLRQSLAHFERIPSNVQHTKPVLSHTYANTQRTHPCQILYLRNAMLIHASPLRKGHNDMDLAKIHEHK